jgi:hypothetical protein
MFLPVGLYERASSIHEKHGFGGGSTAQAMIGDVSTATRDLGRTTAETGKPKSTELRSTSGRIPNAIDLGVALDWSE